MSTYQIRKNYRTELQFMAFSMREAEEKAMNWCRYHRVRAADYQVVQLCKRCDSGSVRESFDLCTPCYEECGS